MAAKSPSRHTQVAVGLLAVAVGLGAAALAASHIGKPAGRLDPVVGVIAGFAFAFAGAILVVPERRRKLRSWIGALMIAFVPGDHPGASAISNGNHSTRTHFWQVPGQVLLLSGAALFNLMALWAWLRAFLGKAARA